PPNWLLLNGGIGCVAGSKKFLASRWELRRNSKSELWSWLLPARVTALITPPAERPNSAEYELVRTWNSNTASTPRSTPPTDPGVLLYMSLISVPSSKKLLCSGRVPFIEILGVRPPTGSLPPAVTALTPG